MIDNPFYNYSLEVEDNLVKPEYDPKWLFIHNRDVVWYLLIVLSHILKTSPFFLQLYQNYKLRSTIDHTV